MQTQLLDVSVSQHFNVTQDTVFVLDLGKPCESVQTFEFTKSGVTAKIIGLYNSTSQTTINIVVETIHNVPNTSCSTEVKGALHSNSQSIFAGKIIIKKPAQQTSSYLEHNVLVLGENTKNQSEPILEIEANDVKASHGATTGRIDPMQLFYLKSRGLQQKQAEDLIIAGFFNSLLLAIPNDKIQEYVKSYLNHA
jgi:Fe-S cluster assembly protein SufD